MTAKLVGLALGYALGGGVLRRKGTRQRPWLELRRSEVEHTYLLHQVRSLQQAGAGPVRTVIDQVPGKLYYDISRARLQHDGFERALELLLPGDQALLTPQVLDIAGDRGLANIWLFHGRWDRGTAVIALPSEADAAALAAHLGRLGVEEVQQGGDARTLRLARQPMAQLAQRLRPHVHRSMTHALRSGSLHGRHLMRCR